MKVSKGTIHLPAETPHFLKEKEMDAKYMEWYQKKKRNI
jgi:hypothetical protein